MFPTDYKYIPENFKDKLNFMSGNIKKYNEIQKF